MTVSMLGRQAKPLPASPKGRRDDVIAHREYLSYIDSLRAIAVLAVILYHLDAGILPGGFVGVDIFFVISGFVVSRSVSQLEGTSFIRFLTYFYSRRLFRIAPALTVCLLVSTLASVMFIPYAWLSGTNQRTGLAAFFGFSNVILARTSNDYFSPRADFNSFTHTWSLAVEEQFYLIFPLLFIGWPRGRRRVSIVIFAVLSIVSFGFAVHLAKDHSDQAFYLLSSRFWELAAGVLLSQLMSSGQLEFAALPWRRYIVAGSAASLSAIAFALLTASPKSTPFPGAIAPTLGTLGFIVFLKSLPSSSLILIVFSQPVLRYIGRISYSLYLWHWPVFVLFRWTTGLESAPAVGAALAITFAASVASFRWVETPARRILPELRLPRIAAVGIGLATILAGWGVASGLWSLRSAISLSTVNRNAGDWYPNVVRFTGDAGCKVQEISKPIVGGGAASLARIGCDQPVAFPHRLFVFGDSHADAYALMLKQMVLDTGAAVSVYNSGGCGFVSLLYPESPSCAAFKRAAIADALTAIQPGDVVFLPALRLPRLADEFVYFGEDAALPRMAAPATVTLRNAQEADAIGFLKTIAAHGASTVFEAPLPVFKIPTFRCADWFDRENPICAAGSTIDRGLLEKLRAPVLESFFRLRGDVENVYIWDPLPVICPGQKCSEYTDRGPIFFDADHLSGLGDRLLAPSFERFIMDLPGAPN